MPRNIALSTLVGEYWRLLPHIHFIYVYVYKYIYIYCVCVVFCVHVCVCAAMWTFVKGRACNTNLHSGNFQLRASLIYLWNVQTSWINRGSSNDIPHTANGLDNRRICLYCQHFVYMQYDVCLLVSYIVSIHLEYDQPILHRTCDRVVNVTW